MQPKQQTQLGLEVERRVAGGKVDRYESWSWTGVRWGGRGAIFQALPESVTPSNRQTYGSRGIAEADFALRTRCQCVFRFWFTEFGFEAGQFQFAQPWQYDRDDQEAKADGH